MPYYCRNLTLKDAAEKRVVTKNTKVKVGRTSADLRHTTFAGESHPRHLPNVLVSTSSLELFNGACNFKVMSYAHVIMMYIFRKHIVCISELHRISKGGGIVLYGRQGKAS